ncbi:tyrosine-type recombinase/integrase [Patescibacteria group bacterium]|nr:tyrosine-type recombinase/integrase [Patescibacteria group bacterium]MBU1889872.1 tyrosine-type recombinase/integrase [Patescibacteria group bacterium]
MTSPSLKQLIKEFLDHLEIERNCSLATKRNYKSYLNRFLEFSKIKTADDLEIEVVRKYRLWLNRQENQRKEPLNKSTQNYYLIALRSFLKYLAKRDIKALAPEKIELAKMPDRQVTFLEGEDLERFLEAPLKSKEPPIIQKRDKAILELLFSTGLRVSELANLTQDQINLKKDDFTVRGKGSKLRLVFLSNQAKYWLKQYLDARQDASLALFVRHDRAANKSNDTKHLTPRSIQRLVQYYAKSVGITKRITPHVLRHSYATDLLTSGADIRSVQSLLGHASITTTQIYTHITNQQLKDVYNAFHARKRGRPKKDKGVDDKS